MRNGAGTRPPGSSGGSGCGVVIAAVSGGYVRDLDPVESNKLTVVLLTSLVADMRLDEAGLDEFIAKARALADELLS